MSRRALGALVLLLLAAGCAREPLPSAGPLLRRSSAAMSRVSTVGFGIEVDGIVVPLDVQSVHGVLTRKGDAKGSVKTAFGDTLDEEQFVLVSGRLYLKGATGGYQRIPESLANSLYDPHILLATNHGLPAVLAGATGAKTVGTEQVGGVKTYRVRARATTELLNGLTLLEKGQDRVPATFWIAGDGRLMRAEVRFRSHLIPEDTTLTLNLSKFDEPVSIKPPPTTS